MELFLTLLATLYLIPAVTLATIYATAVFRCKGFDNFAAATNMTHGTKLTSNFVQWIIVLTVLFWPTIILARVVNKRSAS